VLAPLREEPCHPGRHQCTTDTDCEDEEALFLDMDERAQEDTLELWNMKWNGIESRVNALPITIKEQMLP
jgi:hypothetical protein